MVPISSLVRDPSYQVRARLDGATISSYANVLAIDGVMPPIQVASIGGALVVVDGWHRLAAHERRGITHVEAVIIEATASDARWMAAAANLTHGLPLRKAEIRTAFKALIHAREHIAKASKGAIRQGTLLSYRDLAALLRGAVRHTTLANWMARDFPEIAKRMAHDEPARPETPAKRDDEASFYNTVMASFEAAMANAMGVHDPGRRGTMIEAAERMVERLRKGGGWVLRGPFEF